MALFHKNKKFPKYPASSLSNLPKYESQMDEHEFGEVNTSMMKNDDYNMSSGYSPVADEMPQMPEMKPMNLPDLNIPIRRPEKFDLRLPEMREEPTPARERFPEKVYSNAMNDNSPIYVKLEDYKKAIRNISFIRDKLNEAENVLRDIMELKKEEDQQLVQWQKELIVIKSKLLEVDNGLFEVSR